MARKFEIHQGPFADYDDAVAATAATDGGTVKGLREGWYVVVEESDPFARATFDPDWDPMKEREERLRRLGVIQ